MSSLFDLYPPQPQPSREERKRYEILDRIVPVVKAMERVVFGAAPAPDDDESLIHKPLVADLVIHYAEDLPECFAFLSNRRMRELELDPESLHDLAVRNLPNRIPPVRLHGESPRFMLGCGGAFESSLLLMDELWESLSSEVPGDPMVALPSRDALYVSGSGWEGARGYLTEMANREPKDLRFALTKRILVRRAGKWGVVGVQ